MTIKPGIPNDISTDFFEERLENAFSLHFSVQIKQGSETWKGITTSESLVISFKRTADIQPNKRIYISCPVLNLEMPSYRLSKL